MDIKKTIENLTHIFKIVGYTDHEAALRTTQFLVIVEDKVIKTIKPRLTAEQHAELVGIRDALANKPVASLRLLSRMREIISQNIAPEEFGKVYKGTFDAVLSDYIATIDPELTRDQRGRVEAVRCV